MEQILKPHKNVLTILGKGKPAKDGYRMMRYCLTEEVEDGILLFHLLTRELLLLSKEEYASMMELEYLKAHWFLVPEDIKDHEQVELVRYVLSNNRRQPKYINNYTILTTTDCNARCFYCYELGCKKVTMNEETAHKTVEYIKKHRGNEKVKISWFGGEPLMNYPAIDRICQKLQQEGIPYVSRMTSNGYLFDEAMVERAKASWNLTSVQITLDGTEDVYNRSKAFVYKEGSAYQVVTDNISRLLAAEIKVMIRLNMNLKNAQDLLQLADILKERFAGKKGLRVYPYLLFDASKTWEERYSLEEWNKLYELFHELEEKLDKNGLMHKGNKMLKKELPLVHCMADSGNAVVVVPDGHLGLCEHYTDSEFFGHIDSEERDQKMIESWKERIDELLECKECFYYPECVTLKKCTGVNDCFKLVREAKERDTRLRMGNEYRVWKSNK